MFQEKQQNFKKSRPHSLLLVRVLVLVGPHSDASCTWGQILTAASDLFQVRVETFRGGNGESGGPVWWRWRGGMSDRIGDPIVTSTVQPAEELLIGSGARLGFVEEVKKIRGTERKRS